jgi:hypothetical protein
MLMNTSTYASAPQAHFPEAAQATAKSTATSASGKNHDQLEAAAAELRDKLASTVKQLSKRWKNMFNVKDQVRHHPLAFALGSTAILFALGGITVGMREGQKRKSLSYRVKHGVRKVQHMFNA